MKNRTISEYGVFKKNGNEYYVVGKTIAYKDDNGYYDLIGNRPIKIFDYNNFIDGEEGIMFEKNIEYYLHKQDDLEKLLKQFVFNKLQNIEEILKKQQNKDKTILRACTLLQKSSVKNIKKLQVLENIIEYLYIVVNKPFCYETNYQEHIIKKEQYSNILKYFESIKNYYDNYHRKYTDNAINIKLLSDLNKDPKASRISTKKSLNYYAQSNGMLPASHEEWVKVNSLKKA